MGKGKNFNEFTYGVGLEITASSFKQVKDDLKLNLESLSKIVRSFKINPDIDLSKMFEDIRKLQSIINGIQGSDNSFGDFVDKGLLGRVASLESGLKQINNDIVQSNQSSQELKNSMGEILGMLKSAGQIKFPATFNNLFGNAQDMSEQIARTQDQIDNIAKLKKQLDSLKKQFDNASSLNTSGKAGLSERDLNIFIELEKQLDDIHSAAESADPSKLSTIIENYKSIADQMNNMFKQMSESQHLDVAFDQYFAAIDEVIKTAEQKQEKLSTALSALREEQKLYDSKQSAQSDSRNKKSLGVQTEYTGQITLTPKADEAAWKKKINDTIKNLGEFSVQVIPTVFKTSNNTKKEIEGQLAKITHQITADLKVVDNLDGFETRVENITNSIKSAKQKLEEHAKIKVSFDYGDSQILKQTLHQEIKKLKRIDASFYIVNGKKFVKDVTGLKTKAETELKDIPANIVLGNTDGITQQVATLKTDIEKQIGNIGVTLNVENVPQFMQRAALLREGVEKYYENNPVSPTVDSGATGNNDNNVDGLSDEAKRAAQNIEKIQAALKSLYELGFNAPEFLQLGAFDSALNAIKGSKEQLAEFLEELEMLSANVNIDDSEISRVYGGGADGIAAYQRDVDALKELRKILDAVVASQIRYCNARLDTNRTIIDAEKLKSPSASSAKENQKLAMSSEEASKKVRSLTTSLRHQKKTLEELNSSKSWKTSSVFSKLGEWDEESKSFKKNSKDIQNLVKRYNELRQARLKAGGGGKKVVGEEAQLKKQLDAIFAAQKQHLPEVIQQGERELEIAKQIVEQYKQASKHKTQSVQQNTAPKTTSKHLDELIEKSNKAKEALSLLQSKKLGAIGSTGLGDINKRLESIGSKQTFDELISFYNTLIAKRDELEKSGKTNSEEYIQYAKLYQAIEQQMNVIYNDQVAYAQSRSKQLDEEIAKEKEILQLQLQQTGRDDSNSGVQGSSAATSTVKLDSSTLNSLAKDTTLKSIDDKVKNILSKFANGIKITGSNILIEANNVSLSGNTSGTTANNVGAGTTTQNTDDVNQQVARSASAAVKNQQELNKEIKETNRLTGTKMSRTSAVVNARTGRIRQMTDVYKSPDNVTEVVDTSGWVSHGKNQPKTFEHVSTVYKTNIEAFDNLYQKFVKALSKQKQIEKEIANSNGPTGKLQAELEIQKGIVDALEAQLKTHEKLYTQEAKQSAITEAARRAQQELAKSTGAQSDKDINKQNTELSKIVNNAQKKYSDMQYVMSNFKIPMADSAIAKFQEFEQLLTNLKIKQKEINDNPELLNNEGYKQGFDLLLQQMQKVHGEFTTLQKSSENFFNKIASIDDIQPLDKIFNPTSLEQMHDAMQEFANKAGVGAAKLIEFNDVERTASFEIQNGKGQVQQLTVAYDAATNSLGRFVATTKESTSGTQQFLNSLKHSFQNVARYLMSFGSVYRLFAMVKQGVTYVREIDSALTELKKVTDETDASYDQFLQNMSNTASVVGSTVKDLTTMSAEWARLGYSMEEAGKLAQSTAILLNVSEFKDATAASEALISTMQAFQYTADESQHVVDILNEVGNNYAVSSDGIATALQDSASALMEGGNNLEQATALVAAANRVVQDPNSVGSALRTISLRLRGTSVEILEEMGEETEGVVESTSKLQEKIKAIAGVDILTSAGDYKDTYTILKEIGQVWEDMADIDQAALLELMAGKNRANTLSAILSNMEDLEGAYESAMQADGSALRENEAYLDSIQGRIDLFNNSVQTMWMNAINSETVKNFVEFGTTLVDILDKLGLVKTTVAGILTYFLAFSKHKIDLASILGVHNLDESFSKGFSAIGKQGLTGWLVNLLKRNKKQANVVDGILGDSNDIEKSVKNFADDVRNNINKYVTIDTSEIDGQIKSIQDKLDVLRPQLDYANKHKKELWQQYKQSGSKSPATDRDNYIARQRAEIKQLEQDLVRLQQQRDNVVMTTIDNVVTSKVQGYQSMLSALDVVKDTKLYLGNEQDAAKQIDLMANAAQNGQASLVDYVSSLGDADIAMKAYAASVSDGKYSLAGFQQFIAQHNAGIKSSGVAAKAAAVGHQLLNAALSMGISLLASFAIDAIVKGFDKLITTNDELIEQANELQNTYKSEMSAIKENLSALQDLREEFAKLSSGVDDYGNNITLATDDYSRYQEIVKEILGISPSLIDGYDAEGNAIANKNGLLQESIRLMQEEQRLKAQDLVSDENLRKIGKRVQSELEEFETENPLPYGNAKYDFMTAFAEAASDYDNRYEFKDNYDLFKALNFDGYSWGDYGSDSISAQNFASDYYEQIVADLRSEESILRDYFTNEQIKNMLYYASQYEQNIKVYDNKMQSINNELNSTLQSVPLSLTSYYSLNDTTKGYLTQYINDLDVTTDTLEAKKREITELVNFVGYNRNVQSLLSEGFTLKSGKNTFGNVLNVDEWQDAVADFQKQIKKSSYTSEQQTMILSMLGLDDNGFIESNIDEAIQHVENILKGKADKLSTEAQDYLDNLSITEVLHIKANISADTSGLTVEELKDKVNKTYTFELTDYTKALASHSTVISEYQEAIQKLGKGSFTMDDFMELVEKYPDLAKGVDISSNAFYGLSRNLNKAIKSNTKSFINDLKELRYRLLEAGKSTTAIDQLIEATEQMSTNALDDYIEKYSTLADKIDEARLAQEKLTAAMEENPNEGYENRGDALEYMKNKMKLGEIGSESELWSVAEEYGFTYDSALSINENADALARFIAVRDEWFGKDDDGNYTFDGTETFIKAVDKAVDSNARLKEILTWDYDEDKGIFNADFDNENWEEIVSLLGQTEGLVNLTSEEFSDMMVQIGQYFGVKWGDNQDVIDHLDKIATGASDAKTKVEEYGKTMQQYLGSDTTIDLSDRPVVSGQEMSGAGWSGFTDDDYATVYSRSYSTEDGSKTIVVTPILPDGSVLSPEDLENYANKLLAGEEIDPKIDIKLAEFNGKDSIQQADEYGEALHKAQEQYDVLRDPLDINTTIDQGGIEGLAKIEGLQDTITQNSNGVTIIDQDAFEEVLQDAGYTEEYIDRLIKKIQKLNEESENTFSIESKNKDPLGLNSVNLTIDSLKQSLTDLGIEFSEVWGSLLDPNTWFNGTEFTINVTDLVTALKAQGWDSESIKAYCQQLITDTEIEGYNIHIDGIENIDEVIAKAESVPEIETIEVEIEGTAYQDVKNINDELAKLPTSKTVTVNEVTKKTTKKWNPNTKEWEYVAGANGTAHVGGTAFKSGSWGAAKTGTSLVGELGPELLVHGNRWTTVGENGAEFTDVRRGDIIFNHKQTEDLLKNGYITSRGRHVGGSAFANGTNNTGIFGNISQSEKNFNNSIFDKFAETVDNFAAVITDYDHVVQKDASHNKDTWVSKGSFEDGYQFGDYTKLAVGSTWDVMNNFLGGAFDVGEKTIDTVASIIGETIKNEEVAAKFADFIKKDLYSGKDLYEDSWLANAIKHVTGIDPEVDSMYGDKFDGWIQSAGNTGMTALLQYLGVPWWVTSSVSTVGSSMEGALNEGATFDEAAISSSASAAFNILLEKVGGINFGGGKTLSDIASDGLTKNISNTFAKKLTQFGLEHLVFGEGTEEVLEEIGGNFAKWLTYQDDKTFKEMFASPEALDSYIESYIGGALMGEGFGLFKSLAGDNKNVDSKIDNQIDSAKFIDESKQEQSSTQRDFGKPISEELERHIVPGQIAQYSQMLADNTDYVIKQAFRTMSRNVGTLMSNNYLDHDGMRAAWYSNSANESKEYGPYEPGELDNPLHEPRRAVMSDLIMKNPYVVDAKGKTWKELIDPMLFSEDQFNDLKNIQEAQQALTSFIDSIDGHDIDTSYLASTNPYIKEMQKIYSSPWMFKQQKQNKYDQMAEDLKNKYEGYLLSRNMGAFDISSQLMVRAYQAGYGGLIAKDVVDSSGRAADQYVVFDESQIQNIRELIQGFGEVGTNEFDMHILSENARMAYNNLMRESDENYVNQKLNDQIQDLRNVISENEAYLANQYKRVENKDFDMFFNEHTYDSYINSTKENQIKLQQKLESLIRESSEGAVLLDNLDLSLVTRLEDLMSTVSSSDWQIENKEFGGLREDQYYNYKLIKNRLDTEASQKAINDYTKVIESNPPNLEVIDAHAKLIQAEQAKLAEFEQQKLAIEQKIAQLTGQLNQTPEVPEVVPQEPETKTVDYNVIGNGVDMSASAAENWSNVPTNKTTNYTVNTKYNTTGTPPVGIAQGANAAAQAANVITQITGKGFANGSDGVSKTETALVGELGPEMLVRNGRWMTIGDNGAEFTQVKKGDIIFNHKQTEDLLQNGHITSRGKAYASGTAYSTVSGTFAKYTFDGDSSYQKYDVNGKLVDAYEDLSNAVDSLADSTDEFNEVFDWIEVRLEELEESLSLFQASVENASTVVTKNDIIDKMIEVNRVKLDNLAAGYEEYSKYSDALLTKVPEKYRDAVKNGAIAIEQFVGEADETTLEAIQNYREWVQKAADIKQQMEEVVAAIRDLAIEKIDNAQTYGDARVTVENSQNEKLQNAIDLLETMGYIPGTAYYGTNAGQASGSTGMFENSYKKIEYLNDALKIMQQELNKAVENGELVKGTVEWYEQVDKLYQVQSEIDNATKEIEEFQNAINDIKWDNFDQLINRLDYIESETQSLIDLMDSDDMFTKPEGKTHKDGTIKFWTADEVQWTEEGLATLGLHAQQMELAEYKSKQYAEAIDDLTKDFNKGLYSENEYLEKLNELTKAQYDSIEAYYDAQEAIKDLNTERIDHIKDGIEKEIDAYEELINAKKEALNSEKDLYDFQKSVAEKTKDISKIQRQIDALANDNSTSARAKRAQLEADLAEAQADLQDYYYERSISNQQDALDQELEDFQKTKDHELTVLDEYLENIEQVVTDSLESVQANALLIYDTLGSKAAEYNLTLSEAVTTPWQDGALAVSDYQTSFDTAMSSTTERLEEIKNAWQEIIDKMAEYAEQEIALKQKQNETYVAATTKKESTSAPAQTNTATTPKPQQTATQAPSLEKGAYVEVKPGTKWYADSYGGGASGTAKSGNIKYINNGGSHAYNIDGLGWIRKKDIVGYKKGTSGVKNNQLAWIDEMGLEELVMHAGPNGRLQYLTKGTAVIPHDITENLTAWGALDPQSFLDQNRPQIAPSKSVVNTEINLDCSVGELIHIEHCDQGTLPDVEKMVNKAFEKHLQNVNNSIKRFSR